MTDTNQNGIEELLVALIATIGLGFASVAYFVAAVAGTVPGDVVYVALLPLLFPVGVIVARALGTFPGSGEEPERVDVEEVSAE